MDYVIFDKLCKQKGTTPTALSRKLGLSKGNTSSWKKGGNPSVDILIKIADELDCTIDLLLGRTKNSSSCQLSDDEQELLSYYTKMSTENKALVKGEARALSGALKELLNEPKNSITVDYYDLPVSAGLGVYLDSCYKGKLEVELTALTRQADFVLRVSGDSMEPLYHDGDIVVVKNQPTVEVGEIGIFILNNEGFIKKFGGDCLISLNQKYKNIKLHEFDEISCQGKVLGTI